MQKSMDHPIFLVPQLMFFDKDPGSRLHPNLDKIMAFDAHFARIREEAKAEE